MNYTNNDLAHARFEAEREAKETNISEDIYQGYEPEYIGDEEE